MLIQSASRCDEHVELDEIDLAVLNIGLDDEYDQPDGPLTQDQPLFYSTKLPLESPKRDTLDSYQRLRENDNTGNEACENLGKKQRGRKSRTRKKQPRRLPVDELVLTYERVAELHPPEDIGECFIPSRYSPTEVLPTFKTSAESCRRIQSLNYHLMMEVQGTISLHSDDQPEPTRGNSLVTSISQNSACRDPGIYLPKLDVDVSDTLNTRTDSRARKPFLLGDQCQCHRGSDRKADSIKPKL